MLQNTSQMKKSGPQLRMLKFVIDEDLPRSTAKLLKANGFEALDVRDYGLKGKDEISSSELNNQILNALMSLKENDFRGNLIILEPGKLRIRRKPIQVARNDG